MSNYFGKVVLVPEEQVQDTNPTNILTLGEDNAIRVSPVDDIFRSNIKQPLPKDFIVSCIRSGFFPETGETKSQIAYITDQMRFLQVEPEIFPYEMNIIGNAISVFVEGNDIYIMWVKYPDGTTTPNIRQYVVSAFRDCGLIGNDLVLGSVQYKEIPVDELQTTISPNVTMHGEFYKDGFLYYCSRETTGITKLLKVNANNLEDYRVVNPFTGGGIHNLDVHGQYIYFMYVQSNDNSNAHVGRMDLNLNYYEEIFQINQDNTRQAYSQMPFLIYLDEIYIPVVNTQDLTSLRNKLRIMVYDMQGNFKRESIEMEVATEGVSLRVFPHWITAYNGKLIIQTANGSSGVKRIIRVDVGQGKLGDDNYIAPTLEQTVISPTRNITDDNTVTSAGKIYLNSEASSSFPLERRLYVIDDYRDLSTIYEYNSIDYSSGGTPPTRVPKESISNYVSRGEGEGLVPYTGATQDLDLATRNLRAGTVRLFNGFDENNYWQVSSGGINQVTFISPEEESFAFNTQLIDGVTPVIGIPKSSGRITYGLIVNGEPAVTPDEDGIVNVEVSGGATNLGYTPSPTDGTVSSDTGTDAVIPLATTSDSGLLAPADKVQLNNLTTNLNSKIPVALLGANSGVATLDGNGKVPLSQTNDALLGNVHYKGIYNGTTITSSPDAALVGQALPTAASGNTGWYFISTGSYSNGGNSYNTGDWIISSGTAWDKVDNTDNVSSVAGKTGVVTLDKNDVGLGNVDNTSDANKPVSIAQQAALDLKASVIEYPETAYAQTITYTATTAPSGTQTANYQATRIGKNISVRMNVINTVAGTGITVVTIPFPTGLPTPADITGWSGSTDSMYPVNGYVVNSPSGGVGSIIPRGAVRKNAGNYEIQIAVSSTGFAGFMIRFDYWTT